MTSQTYEITATPLVDVEIGATGLRSIFQNVNTIMGTIKGQVMLDRLFGISPDIIDNPIPVAQLRLKNELVSEIEKQEPRVKVIAVNFEQSDALQGQLKPKVTIRIREGVLL